MKVELEHSGALGPSETLMLEGSQEEVSFFYTKAFFFAVTHISALQWAFSAQGGALMKPWGWKMLGWEENESDGVTGRLYPPRQIR